MPLVQISILEGRTDKQKKDLLKAVTQAVHDSLQAPLQTIRVWIHEMPPTEYMIGGELASDRKK
jgi:4-oxalocrotonate tautomerase